MFMMAQSSDLYAREGEADALLVGAPLVHQPRYEEGDLAGSKEARRLYYVCGKMAKIL